jgi:hypothetical protein
LHYALIYLQQLNVLDRFEHGERCDLNMALLVPVSMVARYLMLFSDLRQNTDASHPDREVLGQALDIFSDSMHYI